MQKTPKRARQPEEKLEMSESSKIQNPKEFFEKEGRLSNQISAIHEKTQCFGHYWQNRRKDLVLKEMTTPAKQGGATSPLDVGCAEGLFARKAIDFEFKLAVGLDLFRVKPMKARRNDTLVRTNGVCLGVSRRTSFQGERAC